MNRNRKSKNKKPIKPTKTYEKKILPRPAFASSVQSGMDLRDYFAATALESLIQVRPRASSQTLSGLS
jgi:hypothetical protein